jgi:hypothetical protein
VDNTVVEDVMDGDIHDGMEAGMVGFVARICERLGGVGDGEWRAVQTRSYWQVCRR